MAGLLDVLLGAENPVAQWSNRNSGLLTGLGTSFLSDGMNFAPAQQGAAMDRQAAAQRDADAKLATQTNATKQWLAQNYPDLAQAVDAGLPVSDAWTEAFKRQQGTQAPKPIEVNGQLVDPNTYQVLGDYRTAGDRQSARASVGQPVYMQSRTDPNVWGSFAPMTDGTLINQLTGETANQNDWIVNPAAATGAKAGATVDAKTAAAARAALRSAEVSNVNTAQAIAEVRNNARGMNEWFGQMGPRGVYINPGSEMGKFWAAAEPTNNQAFMQAREALKGGGQITDYEGRKAEDAFSRMRAALEKGDQDQYLRALTDFEDAVALGYQKLVEAANGGYSDGTPGAAGAGNKTSTGVTWSVSP